MLSYYAVSGGYIIAEIVQRVTGRDIRTLLEWKDEAGNTLAQLREAAVATLAPAVATSAPLPSAAAGP
jgi:hypothetical protein